MIELYALHWSHYVEKVRWALDYKQLEYRVVPVSIPGKPEMAHLDCQGLESASGGRVLTVPTILDGATGACVTDSSEIISYLEKTYPESPALFGETAAQRQDVRHWMLYLDNALGLAARRLGYTQLILEAPEVLPELFLDGAAGWLKRAPFRRIAAVVLSGLLVQRFRFLQVRKDRTMEMLFGVLLTMAGRIKDCGHVAGDAFSGADITLACLLRPLRVVPAFREAPELEALFTWQEALFRRHGRESELLYETRIREVRERRGWSMGNIQWLCESHSDDVKTAEFKPDEAGNDQQQVSRVRLMFAWVDYLFLRHFSGYSRRPWHAA